MIPIALADVDLGQPLADVELPGYERCHVLAFLGQRPLGWLPLRCPGGRLSSHAIAAAADVMLAEARWREEQELRLRPAVDAPVSLTVAICTHHRPELLARCLAAVQQQQGIELDVLVIDNAPPDDATRRVVERFAGVRYVREDRQGLDFARNRAIESCRTELLAYLDDDTLPHHNWANAIAGAFLGEPRVHCVTGPVVPDGLDAPAQQMFELHGGFQRGFRAQRFAAATLGRPRDVFAPGVCGAGANMAYRREVLVRLGGFDPRLDAGHRLAGGGDLDMFSRVLRGGGVVHYEPRALVRHRHRSDLPGLRRQIRSWGSGFTAFLCASWLSARGRRGEVVRAACWWLFRYQLRARFVGRLRGAHSAPWSLLWCELLGGLAGPFQFWRSHRHTRQGTP